MGHGGPVAWPPRSPDLTPLDFFLWGYIKEKVYVTPPQNVQDLDQRIRLAFAEIPEEMLANTRDNLLGRVQACIVAEGWQFEYADV
jgi:hypothetical protein